MNLPALIIPKMISFSGSSRLRAVGAPVAAIAASLAVVFFVSWPRFGEVLRLKAANDLLAGQAQAVERKAQLLSSLDLDLLDNQLVAAEGLLPSDKGVFSLVRQIEGAAVASGVLIDRLEVTPGQVAGEASKNNAAVGQQQTTGSGDKTGVKDPAPKIVLKVSFSSGYSSLVTFIGNVLGIPRALSISDISLSATSSEGTAVVRALVTVNGYWQQLPTQLSSIESPLEELTSTELELLSKIKTTGGVGAGSRAAPAVPLGKSDLFAPF